MPQVCAQTSSCFRSSCKEMWSLMELISLYSKQSSAKRRTFDVTESGRSFMWHRKSSGPRTVPWGTPESTLVDSDADPSSTTRIVLLVRKLVSQDKVVPCTPYDESLCKSFWWGTVSKAFEKSNIATSTCLFWSKRDHSQWWGVVSHMRSQIWSHGSG